MSAQTKDDDGTRLTEGAAVSVSASDQRPHDEPTFGAVPCEGCDTVAQGGVRRRGRYPQRFPTCPPDWTQCGRSRKVLGALASWCPHCQDTRWRTWTNPTLREVRAIAKSLGRSPETQG